MRAQTWIARRESSRLSKPAAGFTSSSKIFVNHPISAAPDALFIHSYSAAPISLDIMVSVSLRSTSSPSEIPMQEDFDPYYKWLGVSPDEQPVNYYRLLGIKLFESDADVIAHAADRQMNHIRSFQNGPHAGESQQLLNELATAHLCLLSPEKKAVYDAQLRARLIPPEAPPPPLEASPPPSAGDPVPQWSPPSIHAQDASPNATLRTHPPPPSQPKRDSFSPWTWWRAIIGAACVGVLAVILAWEWTRPGDIDDRPISGPTRPTAKSKETPSPKKIEQDLLDDKLDVASLSGVKDLMVGVDVHQHTKLGQKHWVYEGGVLISPWDQKYAGFKIPSELPQEYALELVVELARGHDTFAITVPVGNSRCTISLDGRKGAASGLDRIKGVGGGQYYENASAYHGTLFKLGQQTTVVCLVRKTGIKVLCRGMMIIDWHGGPEKLERPYYWRISDYRGLALGSQNSQYRVSRLIMAPLPPSDLEQKPIKNKSEEKLNEPSTKQIGDQGKTVETPPN